MIHRICGDRIQERGENHQTLRPDVKKSHEDVLWMFIEQSEPLSESEVDDIVEMDMEEDLEANLRRAVDGLCRVLEIPRPGEDKIGEAVSIARNYAYRPTGRELSKAEKETGKSKKKKEGPTPRYFGILPEIDLKPVVEGALSVVNNDHPASKVYKTIQSKNRVTSRPHITIVHSKSLPDEQQLWDNAMALHLASSPPIFRFRVDYLICNERVMALSIADIGIFVEEDDGKNENTDLDDLNKRVMALSIADNGTLVEKKGEGDGKIENKDLDDLATPFLETILPLCFRLHITVGTADRDYNPFEARKLVQDWRLAGAEEGIKQDDEGRLKWAAVKVGTLWSRGRVKGLVS